MAARRRWTAMVPLLRKPGFAHAVHVMLNIVRVEVLRRSSEAVDGVVGVERFHAFGLGAGLVHPSKMRGRHDRVTEDHRVSAAREPNRVLREVQCLLVTPGADAGKGITRNDRRERRVAGLNLRTVS